VKSTRRAVSLGIETAGRPGRGLPALLVLLVLAGAGQGCDPRPRPFDSVVLVTVDTLRADHMGLFGYPRGTAPFMTRLAHEGVDFRRAYTSSSHTAPAHASIFTSLYPEQHQVLKNGQRLDPALPTLAGLCHQAGLETAAFASACFLETLRPGFDLMNTGDPIRQCFRPAPQTISSAIDWLEKRKSSRRFMLWIHLYDPHEHRPDCPVPRNLLRRMQRDSRARGAAWIEFLRRERGYSETTLSPRLDRYDAQVLAADSQLRRLVEELRRMRRRTLLVITADHGEGLMSHGYMGHGKHLYEEQLHVPLIFYAPDRSLAPATVERPVRHVDLLPTVMALLGLKVDLARLRLEGRSIAALLEHPEAEVDLEYAFAQRRPADKGTTHGEVWSPGRVLAVVGPRYKYIFNEGGRDELYDLASDPLELHNRIDAGSPEKARLHDWLLAKDAALRSDHRVRPPGDVDPRLQEQLRALGYF